MYITTTVGGVKSLKPVANTRVLWYNMRYGNGLNRARPAAISPALEVNYIMKPYVYTRKDVICMTTLSRSAIDKLERNGEFPKRIKLTDGRVAWVVVEVDEWFAAVVKNANR